MGSPTYPNPLCFRVGIANSGHTGSPPRDRHPNPNPIPLPSYNNTHARHTIVHPRTPCGGTIGCVGTIGTIGRIDPRPPWGPKNLYLRPPGPPWGPRPCPGRSIHILSWCLDPQILKIHDLPHQKPIFSYFSNIFGTRRRRRRPPWISHPPSSPSHTGKKHGVRPRILT